MGLAYYRTCQAGVQTGRAKAHRTVIYFTINAMVLICKLEDDGGGDGEGGGGGGGSSSSSSKSSSSSH